MLLPADPGLFSSNIRPSWGHTGGVEIEISQDSIRLGQLLKFANFVTDGGEARALIASGYVSVDGEPETRRGRQVHVGSLVEVDLPQGREEVRIVAAPSTGLPQGARSGTVSLPRRWADSSGDTEADS